MSDAPAASAAPKAQIFVIQADSSSWEYNYTEHLQAFHDEAVAELVVEELMKEQKKRFSRIDPEMNFSVVAIDVSGAESESRVRGIFKKIMAENFGRGY